MGLSRQGAYSAHSRDNYTQFNAFYRQQFGESYDFVRNPNLLSTNEDLSVISAMWFFKTRVIDHLNTLNVENVTERINGGDNGINDRLTKFNKQRRK